MGDLSSIPGLGRSPGEGETLPTPVFWPGEFHGLYTLWGRKESDMTERLLLHFTSGALGELNEAKHVIVLRTVLKGILSFVLIINK